MWMSQAPPSDYDAWPRTGNLLYRHSGSKAAQNWDEKPVIVNSQHRCMFSSKSVLLKTPKSPLEHNIQLVNGNIAANFHHFTTAFKPSINKHSCHEFPFSACDCSLLYCSICAFVSVLVLSLCLPWHWFMTLRCSPVPCLTLIILVMPNLRFLFHVIKY